MKYHVTYNTILFLIIVSFLELQELDGFAPGEGDLVELDEGASYTLVCNPPRGSPQPDLFWTSGSTEQYGESKPVAQSERVNMDLASGNLVFANVLSEDEGFYFCNAKNSDTNRKFSPITGITINGKDKLFTYTACFHRRHVF